MKDTMQRRLETCVKLFVRDAEVRTGHTMTDAEYDFVIEALTGFVVRGAMKFVLGSKAHAGDAFIPHRQVANELGEELIDAWMYLHQIRKSIE